MYMYINKGDTTFAKALCRSGMGLAGCNIDHLGTHAYMYEYMYV